MANKHVVRLKNGNWGIKNEGNPTPIYQSKTQANSIKKGISLAKKAHSELVIHGMDGKIRDKDSYGNDPYPPRDKKF